MALNRLARWSVMGRKDYNEALITVVKLSGVLQAFSGPVRAPQARRLLNVDRVEKWLQRAFTKGLKPAACAVTINSPGAVPRACLPPAQSPNLARTSAGQAPAP